MTKSEIVRKLTEAYFDLTPEEMPSLRDCMQFYAELKEKEMRAASGLSRMLVEQIKSYGRLPGKPLEPTAFVKITTEKEETDAAASGPLGTQYATSSAPAGHIPLKGKALPGSSLPTEDEAEKPTHTHTHTHTGERGK